MIILIHYIIPIDIAMIKNINVKIILLNVALCKVKVYDDIIQNSTSWFMTICNFFSPQHKCQADVMTFKHVNDYFNLCHWWIGWVIMKIFGLGGFKIMVIKRKIVLMTLNFLSRQQEKGLQTLKIQSTNKIRMTQLIVKS